MAATELRPRSWSALCCALFATVALAACSDDSTPSDDATDVDASESDAAPDARDDADVTADDAGEQDADGSGDATGDAGDDTGDTGPDVGPPVPRAGTDESRARAFQLYYRERVDRMLVAYNRFGLVGDTGWALALRGAWVAREGDAYEIVLEPKDNNLMGTPMRSVLHAWRNLGSDNAELTLLRMLHGFVVFEQITGHPGLTSRNALPGWTLEIDGDAGTAVRTRDGETVASPYATDPDLEAAVIDAFFDGVSFRYRLNPRDTMLTFLPGRDPEDYAIIHSMPDLPDFIRNSDCCSTMFRTPEGYAWEDAWWGNHNSRDNYPDIALGLLTALELQADPDGVSEELLEVAAAVTEAGRRIADLVEDNDGNVMTVDEYNPYDTLVISGLIRPHGLAESEGLGGMSSCPMALLNRALSTEGLESEPEELWLPGSPEYMITPDIAALLDCPFETPRACRSIDDAWCGHTWESIFDLQMLNQNWLELARNMEAADPGSSGALLGAFQNDYDDVVEAMVTLIAVLDAQGNHALAAEARETLGHMTDLMREFADIVYGATEPERTADQRYAAALFDAMAYRDVVLEDLSDFSFEEERLARIESSLEFPEATPDPLYTDEDILRIVTEGLANLEDKSGPGRSDAIRARYAATYPDGNPPIRRAGDAYEARQGDGDWFPAERPRHRGGPNIHLLEGIVLCTTAPHLLDCTWARLGCAKPDLDDDGTVDADDTALFLAAVDEYGDGAACETDCGGADLDDSGVLDGSDAAFMEAAQGCTY